MARGRPRPAAGRGEDERRKRAPATSDARHPCGRGARADDLPRHCRASHGAPHHAGRARSREPAGGVVGVLDRVRRHRRVRHAHGRRGPVGARAPLHASQREAAPVARVHRHHRGRRREHARRERRWSPCSCFRRWSSTCSSRGSAPPGPPHHRARRGQASGGSGATSGSAKSRQRRGGKKRR